MDESTRNCTFCSVENPPYTCPRCQQPYCSLVCYQSVDHQYCSENFYKEWVKSQLSGSCASDEGKAKMMEILKRLHDQEQENALDSDDSDDPQVCPDTDASDLNTKLLSKLQISTPDDLWNTLTPSDKEAVKELLDTREIPVWRPWWYHKEPARKLVTEVDAAEERQPSSVPNIPETIPKLCTLTSRKPSDGIQYQILNLLAAYVFTARHFNGEHVDEAQESGKMIIQLSHALQNTSHFGNAVESIYLLQQSELGKEIHGKTLCLVFDDLCEILKGPDNDKNCHYVFAALSDIQELLTKFKERKHSEEKRKIKMAIKKVEYLQSWQQDYGSNTLKQHIPALQIEIVSITENNHLLEKGISLLDKKEPRVVELE